MQRLVIAVLLITGLSGFADAKITVSEVKTYEDQKIIRICKKGSSKKNPVLQCQTITLDEISSYCTVSADYHEAQYASGCCFQKGKAWI